jgi:fatty-acyl-CoA synthase
VSTLDVADVLSTCPGVAEAIVYGVVIPGAEGRAGMAAIVANADFDLAELGERIAYLPDYAQPLFIRICLAFEATGTFKPKKQDLAREGYNPSLTADPIYFNGRAQGAFMRVDITLYERIRGGNVRL